MTFLTKGVITITFCKCVLSKIMYFIYFHQRPDRAQSECSKGKTKWGCTANIPGRRGKQGGAGGNGGNAGRSGKTLSGQKVVSFKIVSLYGSRSNQHETKFFFPVFKIYCKIYSIEKK